MSYIMIMLHQNFFYLTLFLSIATFSHLQGSTNADESGADLQYPLSIYKMSDNSSRDSLFTRVFTRPHSKVVSASMCIYFEIIMDVHSARTSYMLPEISTITRNFVVGNFVVRNFVIGNFVVGNYAL